MSSEREVMQLVENAVSCAITAEEDRLNYKVGYAGDIRVAARINVQNRLQELLEIPCVRDWG